MIEVKRWWYALAIVPIDSEYKTTQATGNIKVCYKFPCRGKRDHFVAADPKHHVRVDRERVFHRYEMLCVPAEYQPAKEYGGDLLVKEVHSGRTTEV